MDVAEMETFPNGSGPMATPFHQITKVPRNSLHQSHLVSKQTHPKVRHVIFFVN